MTVTATPIFPQALKNWYARLLNATGVYAPPFSAVSTSTANLVALVAGSTNGDKVESIQAYNSDTSAVILTLVLITGTDSFVLGSVNLAATVGFSETVPAVDVLRSTQFPGFAYDANGNRYIYVPSGSTLYVGMKSAAITAGQSVFITAQGGSF